MSGHGTFLSGVIEGFYGREWDFAVREAYAGFLSSAGLNTYLYCPKGDRRLRAEWQQDWSAPVFAQLKALAATYGRSNLNFGVGLSPMELYRSYGRRERDQLQRKLGHIGELGAPLLAILFDDMPGDLDGLAGRQAEIVDDVFRWCPEQRILVCPTYYSFDPALETHFGRMPDNYWQDLGAFLPPEVEVFWTGSKVCSSSICVQDIADIRTRLGRTVVLWDNYPVNDGETRSKHLYLQPLHDRERQLRDRVNGHLCNPMNQAWLSLPALLGLVELYGDIDRARHWLRQNLGVKTWKQLEEHQQEFMAVGLEEMGPARREDLTRLYESLPGGAAREAAEWLRGEYAWDPACLTG